MAKGEAIYKKLKVDYADIDRMVAQDGEIVTETIPAALQRRIIDQVNAEYELAFRFNEAKRATILSRLRLYNNQRRSVETVGDPLMFTVFNTVHAALYDDRLMATFEGRGGQGDEDVEENLNALANYDYDLMGKSELDYYWNWDAEFTGRGLVLLMDFDRTPGRMAPVPELIDAVTWIRDPNAKSVNGDMSGKGAMRFGGNEVGATYYDLKKLPAYFNLEKLRKDKEIKSLLKEAKAARSEAQGTTLFDANGEALGKYDNYEFQLLNWFTTIKGNKYLVTLGNCRSVLVRLIPLSKYDDRWPIIDRTFYPMAHDWDGVSIPDLTEDKQRARAVLMNLGLKSATNEVMGQYLFDQTRIKNDNDLNSRQNKFIPVDGRVDNAIMPMQKSSMHQSVNMIMDILDAAAQRATATPEIQQGVMSGDQRTLGELNLISSKVDTRYSMTAKVFGWSERAYWRQWYKQYKIHFKNEIDEKIVRIQGALAPVWRPFTRENIIAEIDPDVKIESRVVSEGKRQRDRRDYLPFATTILQNPENNRRFVEKKLAKFYGATKEEMDMMFPKTVDEMQAEDENEVLNEGGLPKISAHDDHQTHINIHAKANPSEHTYAHIKQHKTLMILKRNRPDLFPKAQAQPFQPPTGAPSINAPVSQDGPPPTTATQ